MKTFLFKDWILTVNQDITQATYAMIKGGSADVCDCFECKNYLPNRDAAFPAEIKTLFGHLGIDYNKENEVSRMYRDVNGLHVYWGFFHFKGTFKGENCAIPIPRTTQHKIVLTSIDENFSIGFTLNNSLAYFEDDANLVQVEFEAKLPWIIQKEYEPEW